jgi:hypothetical protein
MAASGSIERIANDRRKQGAKPANEATQPLPRVEASYTVDPLSDLVSATELRDLARNDETTKKVMRYLSRYREQMVEAMAEGGTTAGTAEATAMLTTESVSKSQMLKDVLTLEAKDIASFYNLDEPNDGEKK